MSQIDWIHGTPLPEKLRNIPEGGTLPEGVTKFLDEQLRAHLNGNESVACVLTTDGHIYYGAEQKHDHPNLFGSPVECAAGIACTSGRHEFRAAAAHRPDGIYTFSGVDLERLTEHFPRGAKDMTLFRSSKSGCEVFQHSVKLPEPAGGRNRPKVSPVLAPAYEKYAIELKLEQILDRKLPREFIRHIDARLRTTYIFNSTADGVTKPGRKRHASCLFTAQGDLLFGVNLRSDVEACDRCSEWTALCPAYVGQLNRQIIGAIVYSPDYKHGRVECCGKCRNALGTCIDPSFGDMLIRYVESGRPPRFWLYSEMPNISYAQAEGR